MFHAQLIALENIGMYTLREVLGRDDALSNGDARSSIVSGWNKQYGIGLDDVWAIGVCLIANILNCPNNYINCVHTWDEKFLTKWVTCPIDECDESFTGKCFADFSEHSRTIYDIKNNKDIQKLLPINNHKPKCKYCEKEFASERETLTHEKNCCPIQCSYKLCPNRFQTREEANRHILNCKYSSNATSDIQNIHKCPTEFKTREEGNEHVLNCKYLCGTKFTIIQSEKK